MADHQHQHHAMPWRQPQMLMQLGRQHQHTQSHQHQHQQKQKPLARGPEDVKCEETAATAPPLKKRKKRFCFTEHHDVLVLREVLRHDGIFAATGQRGALWEQIAIVLNEQGVRVNAHSLRCRLNTMAAAHDEAVRRATLLGHAPDTSARTEKQQLVAEYVQRTTARSAERERRKAVLLSTKQDPPYAHGQAHAQQEHEQAKTTTASTATGTATATARSIPMATKQNETRAGSDTAGVTSVIQALESKLEEEEEATEPEPTTAGSALVAVVRHAAAAFTAQRAEELAFRQRRFDAEQELRTRTLEMQERTLDVQQQLLTVMSALVNRLT